MLIDILTFRLRDGSDERAFLDVDQRFQTEVIPNHHGFLRRTTARSDDGEWAVISLWYSAEDADASAAQAKEHEVVQRFDEFVDESSVQRRRYETLD